ncbi:hypothetical protein ACT8ZV_20605 [Nocardioides sp. MAHUQ-72]|uniref:hypothetical protein n=1 Tax=unclassified Nocardioides TaxID=2615069 RepID=UPI00360A6990
MSADHKRPLLAFVIVALLCALIIADSIRSQAVVGYLRAGAVRVVQGVELAPLPTGHHFVRTPAASAPVAAEPPSALATTATPIVPGPLPSASAPGSQPGAQPGHGAAPQAPGHAAAVGAGHQPGHPAAGAAPGHSSPGHTAPGHADLGHSAPGQQAGPGHAPAATDTPAQHATHESSHLIGSLFGEPNSATDVVDAPGAEGHHGPAPDQAPGPATSPGGPAVHWQTWTGQVHQAPGHGHRNQGHEHGHGKHGHGKHGHGHGKH